MTEPVGELKAELGLLDSTMLNVGSIVGSAIFLVPAAVAASFSSVFPVLLVWVLGAVVSLFGALCVAELGAAMPQAGGLFVYLRRTFGPVWGYLYGWSNATIVNPGSIAALAVGFATYLAYFLPMGDYGVKISAVASIAGLTALNCRGLKVGAMTQNILTLIKIGAMVGLILTCFLLPGGSAAHLRPFWPTESFGVLVGKSGVALVAVLYAYDGWINITYVGSEMRRPARDMPLAAINSTLIVAVLFIGVAVAFTWVLGPAGVGRSPRVAADAATVVMGTAGAVVVTASILVSMLGANNGVMFSAARIPYAMARDGMFFRSMGQVSPRYAVPTNALIAQGVVASLLALSGTYVQLTTYVIFVSFLFYGMAAAAVLVLRRRAPAMARPYRAWGYPITPLVFVAFSAYLIWNTVVEQPRESAVGAGLVIAGLVFYYAFGWNRIGGRTPTD